MTEPYERYPKTCQEWLDKWDAGESVWSVEMGGLGPGYEQAIQITAVEFLRSFVNGGFDSKKFKSDEEYRKECWVVVESSENVKECVSRLGLSGAQYGAAQNIAVVFWRKTPAVALADVAIKNRKIQVSKEFQQ